ncbi:hypothetical protein CBR_g41241 [Chara braunii]|uniref:Uncharacterized protein n=1 Tax=Chara braunii TaxID=69332 RepID=A0A388LVA6_CHABU|nr:hypothetical protein CBR_g41241 [Chara braunii]|eukprot:GBG86248.1 hypothetical protein CBR_g41241 [Chara braunii]
MRQLREEERRLKEEEIRLEEEASKEMHWQGKKKEVMEAVVTTDVGESNESDQISREEGVKGAENWARLFSFGEEHEAQTLETQEERREFDKNMQETKGDVEQQRLLQEERMLRLKMRRNKQKMMQREEGKLLEEKLSGLREQ